MGVDEKGLKRSNCAKLGCFCHSYSGKKAEKKEKKKFGAYYCRNCLHSPVDHVVVAEGITSDIPELTTPGIDLLSPVDHKTMTTSESIISSPKANFSQPSDYSSSLSNCQMGQSSSLSSPNARGNLISESSSFDSSVSGNMNINNNKPPYFGNLTENVRVQSSIHNSSNNSNQRGLQNPNRGNNRGNGNRGNRGNRGSNRGNNRGNSNRGNNTGNNRGMNTSTQRGGPTKLPFGSGFAPRVPSMMPSQLNKQDRGNYDDSHINPNDKVSRLGRNVGLMGPDTYVLSHKDAKYYHKDKIDNSSKNISNISNSSQTNRNTQQSPRNINTNTRNRGNINQTNTFQRGNRPNVSNTAPRGRLNTSNTNYQSSIPKSNTTLPKSNTLLPKPNQSSSSVINDNNNCIICKQIIYGSYMVLGNYSYHKHCCKCLNCKINLFKQVFYQLPKSYDLSCDNCYKDKYCNKCCKCNGPVVTDGIKAMNKIWHSHCFTCSTCNKAILAGSPWYALNNIPYCEICSK